MEINFNAYPKKIASDYDYLTSRIRFEQIKRVTKKDSDVLNIEDDDIFLAKTLTNELRFKLKLETDYLQVSCPPWRNVGSILWRFVLLRPR